MAYLSIPMYSVRISLQVAGRQIIGSRDDAEIICMRDHIAVKDKPARYNVRNCDGNSEI